MKYPFLQRAASSLTLSVIAAALAGAPAAWAAQIVVGQVAPLSGPEAGQGRAYADGMRLAFEAANRAGGINGHTFRLVSQDDGGRAQDTVRATRQLLADGQPPLVLAGYIGHAGLAGLAASGLLDRERIALVGYRAADLNDPHPAWLYNVRAGLRDELQRITGHLSTLGATRLGLLYEDGPGQDALLASAQGLARKGGASIVAHAAYEAGTTRVADAVDKFVQAPPQAIILVCSGAAAARFIEQYRAGGGTAQIFVHSGADMERTVRHIAQDRLSFVSTVMRGVAIVQVVPGPYEVSPLSRELGEAAKSGASANGPMDHVSMEGFIAGKLIMEAVRRQGARPTRAGMVEALDGMENQNLGGHVVGFRRGDRQGSRFVKLTIISDTGKMRQ